MERARTGAADAHDFEELAGYLKALAHAGRLELLSQLRVPRAVGEIRLRPMRHEEGESPDRLSSRNAVERHLLSLKAIGVVVRREGTRDGRQVHEYLLQHARLFQVLEEMRNLTQLRPVDPVDVDVTASDSARVRAVRAEGPHLVLLSGPYEGRAVALEGRERWVLGRASPADVQLDYDPYVSTEHAVLERDATGRMHVRDLETNRNGTFLNWGQLPRGARVPVRSGDVLRLGRSLVLVRDVAEA